MAGVHPSGSGAFLVPSSNEVMLVRYSEILDRMRAEPGIEVAVVLKRRGHIPGDMRVVLSALDKGEITQVLHRPGAERVIIRNGSRLLFSTEAQVTDGDLRGRRLRLVVTNASVARHEIEPTLLDRPAEIVDLEY